MNTIKIENAKEVVKKDNETSIFFSECKIIKNIFYKKKRLIILTERHLFYFTRYLEVKKKLNLLKIEKISLDKKQLVLDFSLDFEEPYQIRISLPKDWGRTKDNIVDKFFFVIQHLLANPEINRITFIIEINDFTNAQQKFANLTLKCYQSYYGTFCRLQSLLENPEIKLDIYDDIRIRFLIFFHKKLVDFTSFSKPESSSKILLEILPLCPSFKYIKIKQFGNTSIFQLLHKYAEYLTSIESISIDGDADINLFNDFLSRMKQNLNSKMVGLSFKNSNFQNDHLNGLKEYVTAKKIQALEFQSCFSDPTVFQFFLSDFLTSLQIPEFTSLFLEEIENINFDSLYEKLPANVKSLSIVSCNVMIDQVFNTLNSKNKESNSLSILNLSYNTCMKELSFTIPSFLTVIVLDHVVFPYGTLIPFLNTLFRTINDDTEISLVHMIANEDDLPMLDQMFEKLVNDIKSKKCQLKFISSLKWDYNPISTNFISFLELQTSLLTLSISGCYSPDDSEGFDDFCEYLSNNRSITKLICRKFKQMSLESLTPKLIEAIRKSKINYLDISNSRGGSQCYDQLKSIVSNADDHQNPPTNESNINNSSFLSLSNLRCLIYDGLKPYCKEQLLDFIQFIDNDEFSCKCSFPIHDIEFLFKSKNINFSDIYRIISHSQIKTNEDFLKPFSTFYKENQNNFPFYFKEENDGIRAMPAAQADENVNNNTDDDFFLFGNDFEKEDEIEIKPSIFFGNEIAQMGPISSSINEDYIFSCKSDDDDDGDENENENNASFNKNKNRKSKAARKISNLASKFKNTKQTEKTVFANLDDFTLIIEEEEEVDSYEENEQQSLQQQKQQQQKQKEQQQKQQQQQQQQKQQQQQQQQQKQQQQKQIQASKSFSNQSKANNMNVSNRRLTDLSNNKNMQLSKNYSNDDEYYSNSNINNKKPANANKTNKGSDYYDYEYSQESINQDISRSQNVKKPPTPTKNRSFSVRGRAPIPAFPRRPINQRPINQRPAFVRPVKTNVIKKPVVLNESDYSDYYYYSYSDEDENDKNKNKNTKSVQKNQSSSKLENKKDEINSNSRLDIPPILSIDTDPNYNVNATISTVKKYEDLKNLQTDSYSSYYDENSN